MDQARLQRLREKAQADRWKVPPEVFSNALERSAEKAFAGRTPSEADLDRYYDSLHLAGSRARVRVRDGPRGRVGSFRERVQARACIAPRMRSIPAAARATSRKRCTRSCSGSRRRTASANPSSATFTAAAASPTWLRSLIAQRFVDRHRETRKLDPLPDESSAAPLRASLIEPRSGSRAIRRGDARRAGGRNCGARAARSPAPRLLLCAGDDARADRHADPRARGHGVARSWRRPARRSAKTSSGDCARRRDSRKPRSTNAFGRSLMTPATSTSNEWLGTSSRRSLGEGGRKKSGSRSFYD